MGDALSPEAGNMDFFIQSGSPVPPYAQIRDQIRLALTLGRLLPGETLPSLRELEEKLGISRDLVRKAYLELAECGLLKLVHGRGVIVNEKFTPGRGKTLIKKCEDLAEMVERTCRSLGVNVYSFSIFFQQKALAGDQKQPSVVYVDMTEELARERADRLANLLRVNVVGYSTDRLASLRKNIWKGRRIICNYYRLGEIKKTMGNMPVKLIPLRMRYEKSFVRELTKLKPGSKVMLIVGEVDKLEMALVLADYKKMFSDQRLEFVLRSVGEGPDRLIKSDGFGKFIVSNRIWEGIPKRIQKLPNVVRNAIEFDPASIEEVKVELGVVA